MTESSSNNSKQLVDHQGTPFPPRVTWRQCWSAISKRTRVLLLSLMAVVAATATLLANLQKIQDYFRPPPPSPIVAPIVVEISNSSETAIKFAGRGDFFLWLPRPGARHTIGKYEFRNTDGTTPDSGVFTVESRASIRILAHIMNQNLYGRVLEQADCDIAFMVRKAYGGLRTTNNLPFTKQAINKYCATVDIGAD